MFSTDETKTCEVVVTLSNGEVITGHLSCGLTGKLEPTLNNEKPFIEITDETGSATFISKTNVAKISQAQKISQNVKPLKFNRSQPVIWFEVLGVNANADSNAVKQAYYDLAKAYHPDIFAIDMPQEIIKYASDKFASINIAYEQYQISRKAA